MFYVQKHITALAMCYNPRVVHDKLLGAPAYVKPVYLARGIGDHLVDSHQSKSRYHLIWENSTSEASYPAVCSENANK